MKKVKTYAALAGAVLFAIAAAAGIGGCAKKAREHPETDALTVMVRRDETVEKFQEKFPDIPFEFHYYDGKNPTAELQMLAKHHDITDIYIGNLLLDGEKAEENLMDLSGYSFCDAFNPSLLNQCDIGGHIYQIPMALTIRCIIYNKEMFDTYGWEEPKTFDELTALCRQIREEADGVTPIVFGGADIGYYFTTMATFAQTEFLYTPKGQTWEREYLKGNAGAKEGFGTGIEMMQELIDAGAFDVEKNGDYRDTEIFQERMETDEAAMQLAWGNQSRLFGLVDEKDDTYAVMPFRNRRGDGFLGVGGSYYIGLSKRLEEPENREKLNNALRLMEWFATEEGQRVFSPTDGSMIYPLKESENRQTIPQFRNIWYENLDDIKAPRIYVGYEDVIVKSGEYIIEAIRGEHDLGGLASYMDELHQAALKNDIGCAEVYPGSFASDFTHEETVQMMAEILHSRKDSDISLVSDGQRIGAVLNYEGVHSRFYQGLFSYSDITAFLPGKMNSGNQVVQMELTGAQIRELLEEGKTMAKLEGIDRPQALKKPENPTAVSVYPYYWAGMAVETKNNRVVSMTLSDGTPVEDEERYTVSFVAGDYMDTTEEEGHPADLGYSVTEIFVEYMQTHSPVSPVKPLLTNMQGF